MISELLCSEIERHMNAMVKEAGVARPDSLKVIVDRPARPEHGDYTANTALLLTRTLRKPPLQIAEELARRIQEEGSMNGMFHSIAAAAPGFLNFYLNWQVWADHTLNFPSKPSRSSTKVLIEHTSINPNKSAHIGHLRNSCIGDTLARMLKYAGYQVEIHNYIDDLGNQLADTVVGILHTPIERTFERFGDFCWETYAEVNRVYKQNPALLKERSHVLQALEEGGSKLAWLGMLTAERIVREQLDEMKHFNIGYDVLVWESSIVREGFWEAAFQMLQRTGIFYKETKGMLAGCWVLRTREERERSCDTSDDGSEHQADKVLVRSNGILTYTAKDIAYHLWKFGLLDKDFTYGKFTESVWTTQRNGRRRPIGRAHTVINVIDRRQEYPQTMVKQALQALGFQSEAERLKHVSYGVVSLSPETAAGLGVDVSEGKGSYPMSGRQGVGIKVHELLEHMERIIEQKRSRKDGLSSTATAAAAVRYYLLKYHLQTEVVFDLRQATEVTGNSGVYLLYAFTRAGSVLGKAAKLGHAVGGRAPEGLNELEVKEKVLLRHIAYWPEAAKAAVEQMAPNLICSYAYELSVLFTEFYSACPILKGPKDKINVRLWLTAAFYETLKLVLDILGLPAPKRM